MPTPEPLNEVELLRRAALERIEERRAMPMPDIELPASFWQRGRDAGFEFVLTHGDAPLREGLQAAASPPFEFVQGHEYGVRVVGGVEEWFEKVDGSWLRVGGDTT